MAAAGFPRYTFVQAPFYFQNFLGTLAPQPLPTGGRGWAIPIDPSARVIHGGDVEDVGRAVAAAFSRVIVFQTEATSPCAAACIHLTTL